MVRDVPSVRAGATEDQQIADAQPGYGLAAGEYVTRCAQFADRVDLDVAHLGPVVRAGPVIDRYDGEGMAVPPGRRQPEVVRTSAKYREPPAVVALHVEHLGRVPPSVGG